VAKGWEPVELAATKIRMPSMIFLKSEGVSAADFLVEEVPHVKGHGEVDEIREMLWRRHDQGWKF